MRTMRLWFVAAVGVIPVVVATPPASAAAIYNAVTDFSLVGNPNGPWSYRSNGSLLSRASSSSFGSGLLELYDNGGAYSGSNPQVASIIRNTGPVQALPPFFTVVIPNDYLNLDPQGTGNVAVRFTAPVDGVYHGSGNWVGNDLVSVPAHGVTVTINGAPIFSSTITQYGSGNHATFDFVQSLMAGDTIDFEALSGASPNHLSTGLAAIIEGPSPVSAVPEPASLALLGIGMLGMAAIRRRKLVMLGAGMLLVQACTPARSVYPTYGTYTPITSYYPRYSPVYTYRYRPPVPTYQPTFTPAEPSSTNSANGLSTGQVVAGIGLAVVAVCYLTSCLSGSGTSSNTSATSDNSWADQWRQRQKQEAETQSRKAFEFKQDVWSRDFFSPPAP